MVPDEGARLSPAREGAGGGDSSRAGRARRRGAIAAGVLLLWLVGIGLLARRELFRPPADRLQEAALRVNPGAVYFAVMQGARHIGFASSTIDTTATGIEVIDYFVADLPVAGKSRRTAARATVNLTRGLRLQSFDVQVQSEAGPFRVQGGPAGDSTLLAIVTTDDGPPDTTRVPLRGPVVLPTLVPLVVALGEEPAVGERYTVETFDPAGLTVRDVAVQVQAESLFVFPDSAAFDTIARRWNPARRDSVRAWRLTSDATPGAGLTTWVDQQGRIVQLEPMAGISLRRTAYELAFSNWRLGAGTDTVSEERDILETTALRANARLDDREYERMVVRLVNVPLVGYDLAGDRQTLTGDTLLIERERRPLPDPGYVVPEPGTDFRRRFSAQLASEPQLQSSHIDIMRVAERIRGSETDPRVVAERINRWVHDSLRKTITVGIPNALQVLRVRAGDCNEHTQLYLALARASGIPARSAAGLAWVDGKFYYHAWPEVWLGRWTAVDPTFGEFPADAAHLRFVIGGLGRQVELLRLIGALDLDVVEAR